MVTSLKFLCDTRPVTECSGYKKGMFDGMIQVFSSLLFFALSLLQI